ncbi:MAG: hypothetical protein ACKO1H_15375 [Tabrizicola sp.]
MLRTLALVLLTATAPNAEEAPVLAKINATSGSLPPPYAWSVVISIGTDGLVSVTRCKGYETEGPACKTGTATTTPEALEAIRLGARASGLATRPARSLDPPMVGGGSISGTVHVDGQTIDLVAQPVPEDVNRVTTLIELIGGVVPAELDPILSGD